MYDDDTTLPVLILCVLALVMVGIGFGMCKACSSNEVRKIEEFKKEAIDEGVAHYNSETGDWEWKTKK